MLCAACTSVSAASNTILVVESYHAEFAWDSSYRQALREPLSPRFALEFFRNEHQATARCQAPRNGQKGIGPNQELRPALVFLADDAALKYLGPQLDALSIPVVYLGINNNPRLYSKEGAFRNITGVLERPLIKAQRGFIRKSFHQPKGSVAVRHGSDVGDPLRRVFSRASILIEGVELMW